MYDRVIVASGDRNLRRCWKDIIESMRDSLALSSEIEACRDAEDAGKTWRQNRQSRDLIIVDRLLPASDDTGIAPSALGGGFDLVQALQRGMPAPACILVGTGDNRITLAALNWPLCGTLTNNTPQQSDMAGDFLSLAGHLAARRDRAAAHLPLPTRFEAEPWSLLEINLNGATSSYFSLQTGNGTRLDDKLEHPFALDMADLQKIIETSRALRQKISEYLHDRQTWRNYVSEWKAEYEKLGRNVYNLINRDQFHYYLGISRSAKQNARIRFVLDRDAYDGLWESIFHPREKWLMLNNTIARRARITSTVHAHSLDGGDGTVHMLAIASNVPDQSVPVGPNNMGWQNFWNGYYGPKKDSFHSHNKRWPRLNEVLPPLVEVDKEMLQLRKLEESTSAPWDVEFLKSEGSASGKPLAERVEEALTRRAPRPSNSPQFDVVHFAGHAIFTDADRGYLVFGDDPCTQMVPIAEFAGWLRKAGVQMVYLSCCRSSAARAAFELADAGIPLAIGFTWDLDSALAVEFATAFYGGLLANNLKVCKAFQSARQTLSDKHGEDDPIWTSPVLVAQPTDWFTVESCLAAGR